jgi:hypothetical protein
VGLGKITPLTAAMSNEAPRERTGFPHRKNQLDKSKSTETECSGAPCCESWLAKPSGIRVPLLPANEPLQSTRLPS